MKVYRRLEELPIPPRPRAVALGNFDGLHLGHRRILKCLVEYAGRKGLSSLLLTFSPHPEKVLGRGRVLMIEPLGRRLEDIRALGVGEALVMPFNRGFSALSPVRFMEEILVRKLGARAVFVGSNFHFGRHRSGDVRTLEAYGRRTRRFEVCVVPPAMKSGRIVSSSLIRGLLLEGKVERAAELLGRPFGVSGTVVRGRSLGRRIGFPTANLRTDCEILPPGIFISRATIGRGVHPSLTYIGRRPTFGPGRLRVETFLLGFRGRLYGRRLSLELLKKLRGDRKFPDVPSLIRQIERDSRRAEDYFRRLPAGGRRH